MHKPTSCTLAVLLGMGLAAPVLAQPQDRSSGETATSNSEPALEEITVTAQKRSQNIQQVPIVVNALSAEMALARGIEATTDLPTIAPGLQFNRTTFAGLAFMRGVGGTSSAVGQEGPVAFYLDDVYIYSLTGNMFELNNVDRVEVLSGPQGTLFGRNALGGVIQIMTKQPKDTPSLDARIGYGSYDTVRADLYATTGLTTNLAADIAILYTDQGDGFGRNLVTGKDAFKTTDFSARTKLLWSPTDATSVQFGVLYDRHHSDIGMASRLLPGSLGRDGVTTAPADFYDVTQNLQSDSRSKQWIGNARVLHDFGGVSVKNIVAYQHNRVSACNDIDQIPRVVNEQCPIGVVVKTWTEEFQISSNEESNISWIAGLFYLNNKSSFNPVRFVNVPQTAFGTYFDLVSNLNTQSYAGYAQATVPIGSSTNVTGGVRYTYDKRQVSGGNIGQNGMSTFASQRDHWSKVSYRASLDHQFSRDILGYLSYNRGFRAGTFNSSAPADPGVKPEVIDDYEAGLKTELFDRRVRLNLAGFYFTYKGIQLRRLTGTATRLLNAASSEHYGIDASIEAAVTDNLRVQGAMEWLHAEFTDFSNAPATRRNPAGGNSTVFINYAGRDMLSAPKFVGTIGAQYKIETSAGDLSFAGNYTYNDGSSWSLEIDDRTREKSFSLLNLSATWTSPSGQYDVRIWGKNVTGTKYNVYAITSANGDYGAPGAPATFGVTLGVHLK